MSHDSHSAEHTTVTTHEEAHSSEHDAKPATSSKANRMDPFFDKVSNYVTGKISTFVAFLFALITVGAIYAVIITGVKLTTLTLFLLLGPAIVGLIAYQNRDIAVGLFVVLFIAFFFI